MAISCDQFYTHLYHVMGLESIRGEIEAPVYSNQTRVNICITSVISLLECRYFVLSFLLLEAA